MVAMPGKSYSGPSTQLSMEELKAAVNLGKDVNQLAGTIGERNLNHNKGLQDTAQYIKPASLNRKTLSAARSSLSWSKTSGSPERLTAWLGGDCE